MLITITDYNDRELLVPVGRIVVLGQPTGRVHDNGYIKLDTGEKIELSDRSSGLPARIAKAMGEWAMRDAPKAP